MNKDQKKQEDDLRPLYIFFGIVVILWVLTFVLLQNLGNEERGTFGDMFGSVNALYSGLALAGIIFTILLQKKELTLQRIELSETRQEFKIQNETLRQQRFENTLFQMISIHHEIIDKLMIKVYGEQPEQREVFEKSVEYLMREMRWSLRKQKEGGHPGETVNVEIKSLEDSYSYLKKAYNVFYFKNIKQALSHYYRNIYHIFKFIYKSQVIADERKQFYASLVRAQLSSDELLLIFYNSLVPNLGHPNFLFFIREFDLMQNFDFDLLSEFKFHKGIFEQEKAKLNQSKIV